MINQRQLAYSEVYAIISKMNKKYMQMLPISFQEIIIEEMDNNYVPNIDSNIPLTEQKLYPETYTILAMINLNYWCKDENHKNELIELYRKNSKIKEQKLKEKYNSDDIFKRKEKSNNKSEKSQNTLPIEAKELSLFDKFIAFIKKLFRH